jgi:hypothetical protein
MRQKVTRAYSAWIFYENVENPTLCRINAHSQMCGGNAGNVQNGTVEGGEAI